MLALMEMTNPMWEWLIAPMILVTIGLLIGYFVGRWEKETEALERWDLQDGGFSALPDLTALGSQDWQPYDQEKDRNGDNE